MSGDREKVHFKAFYFNCLKALDINMIINTTQQNNILIPNPKYRLSNQMILPQSGNLPSPRILL